MLLNRNKDLGRLLLTTSYTHLMEQKETVFGITTDYRGTLGYAKHRALSNVLYSKGPLQFNWSTTFISSADVDVFAEADRGGGLGRVMFHDAQVRYRFGQDRAHTLVVGVDNIFDKFVDLGGSLNDVPTGHRTAPETYEPFGRAWYVGLKAEY